MKLFYYTRKVKALQPEVNGEVQEPKFDEYKDCFNLDLIVRSIAQANGTRKVWLNDYHEERMEVPVKTNTGRTQGSRIEKMIVYSEILLLPEDAERFVKQTENV